MGIPTALHFHGPLTFVDRGRGLARSEFARSDGIYLWTQTDGRRRFITYVGETTNLLKRHKEHLTQMLGLNYGLFRPDSVAADDPAPVYGGMWRDRSEDPLTNSVAAWRKYAPLIVPHVEAIAVFFAPTSEASAQERKHVEACIARQLRERHPLEARFYPVDNKTIPRKARGVTIAVTSDVPIEGLDGEIEV